MGKHNRIEFNDFGDSKKNSDKDIYDDFLGEDTLGEEWGIDSDVVMRDAEPRYRKTNTTGSGLYADDFSEDFADDFGDDFYGDEFGGAHKDEDAEGESRIANEDDELLDDTAKEGPVLADFDDDDDDMFNPKNRKKSKDDGKKAMIIAGVSIGVVIAIVVALFITVLSVANKKTIYDGITLYGKDFGGMTQAEASEYVTQMYIDPIYNADITIELNSKQYVYPMSDFVICPNADDIAAEAYKLHRDESLFKRFFSIIKLKSKNYRLGLTYSITDEKLNDIMASAEDVSFKDPVNPNCTIKSDIVTFAGGKKGTSIDKNKFEQDLYAALSDFEQEMQSLGTGESLKNVTIVAAITDVDFKHLDAREIYNKTYVAPQNPYFYKTTGADGKTAVGVASQVPGKALDEEKLKSIVGRINAGEDIPYASVGYVTVWADMSKDELWSMLFRDELASSTTVNAFDENDPSTLEDQANRDNNFSVMAPKLDETIIMPGDRFSFNEVIGTVSSSNGYVYARENTASKASLMGGGVSQAATTIYVAALKSGLSVMEHTNNEYLPYYGTAGLDAYVNLSSGTTMAFVNNTNYPIKVNFYYDGSSVSVSIYGTNDGVKTCTLKSEPLGTTVDGEFTIYKYKVSRSSSSFTEELGEVSYKGSSSDAPITTESPDNSALPTESILPTEDVTGEPTETPTATESEETNTASPTETNATETPSETASAEPTIATSATPTEGPAPTEGQNSGHPARPERPEP